MKTIILYGTSHGTTEKCSKMLADKIGGNPTLVNLQENNNPNLSEYDIVIIGSSIVAGKIRKHVKNFANKNVEALLKKKVGIFLCCMEEENPQKYINENFPEEIVKSLFAVGFFGGEFIFEKMGGLERFIIKKMSKTDKNVSKIKEENISKFAETVKKLK